MERNQLIHVGVGAAAGALLMYSVMRRQSSNKKDLRDLPCNRTLSSMQSEKEETTTSLVKTEADVLGPFFVLGSPFRGKLSPPLSEGVPLIIKGCVRDINGKPQPYIIIDLWQASPNDATYDFYYGKEELKKAYHPRDDHMIIEGRTGGEAKEYKFRTRILTDHLGRYEFETVQPPPYFDPDDVCECNKDCLCAWRCPHIHAFVQPHEDCQPLITQL